jgi:cation transport regulator
MPYQVIAEVPLGVHDNLPRRAQEIFLNAYIHAWEEHKISGGRREVESRSATAREAAWVAVEREYMKNVFTGEWERK